MTLKGGSVKGTVLLVDDQDSIIYAIRRVLEGLGYEVLTAADISQAVVLLDQADIAILDIRLEGESGIDLLGKMRDSGNEIPVIILSAWASPDNLVLATRYGAIEILRKPVGGKELAAVVEKAFSKITPKVAAADQVLQQGDVAGVIGNSPAMLEVFKSLGIAASNDLSVLLTGETGVGKDVSAQLIHTSSARSAAPFIAVNTTAIPGNLFEAELFGYAAGAFTGARQDAEGLIESAAGGTLFLDEIGDLPLASQAKLLRFLEDQTFNRLGDSKQRQADVRIIAATNQKLVSRIEEGLFREDLYYRLALIPIEVPPLRERLADLPALIDNFLKAVNQELDLRIEGIAPAAVEQALQYAWPGNIRELKNTVFRTAAGLQSGLIEQLDINLALAESTLEFSDEAQGVECLIQIALKEDRILQFTEYFEQQVLAQTLDYYQGNRSRVAEVLGTSRNTLRTKLRAYGLDNET